MRQAASLLRCADKQLWRRIEFYVSQARAQESFAGVQTVGIDETSLRLSATGVIRPLQSRRNPATRGLAAVKL